METLKKENVQVESSKVENSKKENVKKPSVKKTIVSKEDLKKIKDAKAKGNLNSLNLDKLSESLGLGKVEDVKNISSQKGNSDNLYKIDYNAMTGEEKKTYRNSHRRIQMKYAKSITMPILNNSPEIKKEIQKSIISFLKYYKDTYRINNFEISSLRSRIDNSAEKKLYFEMLDNVKAFLKQNKIDF